MLESLLEELKKRIEAKEPISPLDWLDTADRLNILRSDYDDKLWQLGEDLFKLKAICFEQKKTGAHAEAIMKSTELYKSWGQLKSKLSRIDETIRLSKVRARLSQNEWQGSR